jgi:hypothetical protein
VTFKALSRMQRGNHCKLPISALLVCCVLGLTLLMVPDHGKCVMTYMWPSYHTLTELANLGQQYELYLYKEGRQSLSNSRKVQPLLLVPCKLAAGALRFHLCCASR